MMSWNAVQAVTTNKQQVLVHVVFLSWSIVYRELANSYEKKILRKGQF